MKMNEANEPKREWSIREYRESDEEQILELRKIVFNENRDKQWWQWIHRNSPFGPATIIVAEINGRIIGHHATIPVPIKIGDQATRGSHGIGLMVHPDYRRQGLFIAMANALRLSPSVGYRSISVGTPSDQAHSGFVNKLNVSEICEVPNLVKVIDWGTVLKQHYKIPAFAGRPFCYIREQFMYRMPSPKDNGIKIEEVTSFDERIDTFWQKASKMKNIMIIRDRKYLNWRYVANPGNKNKIWMATKQQEIAGYIVSNLEKGVLARGYIVDILTLPGEDRVARLLIARAIRYLKEEGAATISCRMLPDTPYYRILRKMGFVRRPGPCLCSTIYDPNIPKEFVKNPANWYHVIGDDYVIM
jgi:GNAT superfamily N-acetyltransferase